MFISYSFHESSIINLGDEIGFGAFLFHHYPEWLVKNKILHVWRSYWEGSHHNNSCFILNLGPNFIDPKLYLLEHVTDRITIELPTNNWRSNKFAILPFNVKVDNGHRKLIILSH
jgi:hypothetical protein